MIKPPVQRRVRKRVREARSKFIGLDQCDAEFKAWIGCIFTTTLAQGGFDCQVDCDAVIGTPSRPSTLPPTMPTRPPTGNDSDGALGLTTTLAATAVAVAAAF